jgi:hypothetical protein
MAQQSYRKVIYLLVFVLAAVPMIVPFGLPVIISIQSRSLYNYIENLPAGSVVAVDYAAFAGMYPDAQAATRAVLIQLFSRPLKFVLWSSGPDGPMLLANEMKGIDTNGKVYGQDYVFLPYAGGGENTLAAMAQSIRGIYTVDNYGTPLNQIPIMQNIDKAEDFKMILVLADAGGADTWAVRQWTIPHGVPEGGTPISIEYPTIIPYFQSGLVVGMTNGIRGGAEYELLIGVPGTGLQNTDVLSTVHLLMVGLVIFGNIQWIMKRGGKA